MVDYEHKDLYLQQHIKKQLKIIATDFVGYGKPENTYKPSKQNEGKTYLDADRNFYYKCRRMGVSTYMWMQIDSSKEYELLKFENSDVEWENFELTETLCSESELQFGSCEASSLKFRVYNNFISLKGKWLTVTETLDGNADNPFQFGRYKVYSDVPTADRRYRDVTAYDAMYDILNADMIDWYNEVLPNKDSTMPLYMFRNKFVESFGLKQENNDVFPNDNIIIEKTIEVEKGKEIDNETEQTSILKESALSGKDVITAICELLGCFGHIGRDGKFHYVFLWQNIMGLYPSKTLFPDHAPDYLPQSETGHLYPQGPKGTRIGSENYISVDYEDFICRGINKVQIRGNENDIGVQYPAEKLENENRYVIEDNFLTYGKSTEELTTIASVILSRIKGVAYRPFTAECVGNPCLEVGDAVRFPTKYELIESYILQRTLNGIQSLRDNYSAEGTEKYEGNVNSIQNSIIQLKGKSNSLTRTIEKTQSTITDVENGLKTQITQTADAIKTEIEDTKSNLTHTIEETASGTYERIEKAEEDLQKYADDAANKAESNAIKDSKDFTNEQLTFYPTTQEMNTEIEKTAEKITQTVSKSQKGWAVENIEIKWFGFVNADDLVRNTEWIEGDYYLDQLTGKLYQYISGGWKFKKQLESVEQAAYSKINQTADNITSEVSKTYETKTDANTIKSDLNSKIEQTAGSIIATVSSSQGKYDTTGWDVDLFGYGLPNNDQFDPWEYDGKHYLDLNTGWLYHASAGNWLSASKKFKPITEELSSKLEITEEKIESKVSKTDYTGKEVVSMINQTAEKITIDANKINLNGAVTANERFMINMDGSFNANYGMVGDFYVASGFLEAHLVHGNTNTSLILYPPDKNNFSTANAAIQIRKNTVGQSNYEYPFSLDYGGNMKANDVYVKGLQYISSSAAITSDERLKNSIAYLDEDKVVRFLKALKPCEFKYNDGTSDRMHHGLCAGQVKEAMGEDDWGVYVKQEDDFETQGIRYEELISDLIVAFQNLDKRLASIEERKVDENE